jgi:hypothetical protein
MKKENTTLSTANKTRKELIQVTLFFICFISHIQFSYAQSIFSIVTNPAEETNFSMNISWGCDTLLAGKSYLQYMRTSEKDWDNATIIYPDTRRCNTFNNIYSKKPNGENFFENVVFTKCDAIITNLKKGRSYKYRIIGDDTSKVYYFSTSGKNKWSACIISDFHTYTPLPKRLDSAMDMINTVNSYKKPIDWVMNLGDVCAWGACYSFWKEMYSRENFTKYMWAGLNGNHDDMDRTFKKCSNAYTRDANFYPRNGYNGQEGVCYFFKYSNALFIMLNSEVMRTEEGFIEAKKWVKEVIEKNPKKFIIVCEHYQWFDGMNGNYSQYSRWHNFFDEMGVDLAIAGNNHIYVRTKKLYNNVVSKNGKGTLYLQLPSSDNERGRKYDELKYNSDKISARWSEGAQTIGAIHLSAKKSSMTITLLNRYGKVMDKCYLP